MSLTTAQPGPGMPPMPAGKPILEPSPMGTGALVRTSINAMKERFGLLIGLSAAQVVITFVVMLVIYGVAFGVIFAAFLPSIRSRSGAGVGAIVTVGLVMTLAMVLIIVVSMLISIKYTAMHAVVVEQLARRQDASWSSAAERTRGINPRALSVIALAAAAGIAMSVVLGILVAIFAAAASGDSSGASAVLGVLLGIALYLGMIYVSVRLNFWVQVLAIEGRSGTDVLRRSWELTKGRFWPILGNSIVGGLIPYFVFLVIFAIAGMGADSNGDPGIISWLAFLLLMVASVAASAWMIVFNTVMYIDLVRRKAMAGAPAGFGPAHFPQHSPAGGPWQPGATQPAALGTQPGWNPQPGAFPQPNGFPQGSGAPQGGGYPQGGGTQQGVGFPQGGQQGGHAPQPGAISSDFLPQSQQERQPTTTGGSTQAPSPQQDSWNQAPSPQQDAWTGQAGQADGIEHTRPLIQEETRQIPVDEPPRNPWGRPGDN